MSRWRSSPATLANMVSTVAGCQCCPASTRLAAHGVAGSAKRHSRSCAGRWHGHDPPRPTPARRRRTRGASLWPMCRTGSAGPTATASNADRAARRPCRSAAGSRARGRVRSNAADRPAPPRPRRRLMSSSTKRDAVGWRGSNRSICGEIDEAECQPCRASGVSPARSSRSSTMRAGDLVAVRDGEQRDMRAGSRRNRAW